MLVLKSNVILKKYFDNNFGGLWLNFMYESFLVLIGFYYVIN